MIINDGWAFTANELDKRDENLQTYNSLELVRGVDYTITVVPGYAHCRYTLVALTDKARQLTAKGAALVADGGNLCFGGRDYYKNGDTYTGVVHTD